jgi:hypothetical protein
VVLALALNLVSHTIFWYTLPLIPLSPETAVPLAELVVIVVAKRSLTVAH